MLRRMYATNIKIEKLNINRKESGLCLCYSPSLSKGAT